MMGGRDRTKLVDRVLGQVERVRAVLGDESVPVVGVLCFIEADWPLVGGYFSTRGVRIVSPRRLSKILAVSGGRGRRGKRPGLDRGCVPAGLSGRVPIQSWRAGIRRRWPLRSAMPGST
jgi:hypothetical protein